MLYSRKDLKGEKDGPDKVSVQRYLYKYNHRPELKKLKWHEIDYLFKSMFILKDANKNFVFNLLLIPEASYYMLDYLILIYGENNFDFSKKASDFTGIIISHKKQSKYQSFFWSNLNRWCAELDKGKGKYCSILKPEFARKIKDLKQLKDSRQIDSRIYILREIYIKAMFFHIYYKVRYYFDEKKGIKAEKRTINGINIYADIYTYCHVLVRHYFPGMNKGNIGGSLNDKIPCIDIEELPDSLLKLVELHNKIVPLTSKTEYLLYLIQNNKYIMWLKYCKIGILKNKKGFEIRSFYKCTRQNDLEKYKNKSNKVLQINENIY